MALRPKIVKLAKMVGGLTGMVNRIDENAPEYYALECVVSDEQADVALQLGLRKERTAQYVAEKCGKSLEEARKILLELAQIGVCKVYHNEEGQEVFLVQIFAPGILEMMVNNDEQVKAHPQIGKAFEEYTRLRIAGIAPNLPRSTAIPCPTAPAGSPGGFWGRAAAIWSMRCAFRWARAPSTTFEPAGPGRLPARRRRRSCGRRRKTA